MQQPSHRPEFTAQEPPTRSWQSRLSTPEDYLPDDGLVRARDIALRLGWPLLITGEPGTGKTLFADWSAFDLQRRDPLYLNKAIKFHTKSDSVARDLFYTYDALARFRDIQANERHKPTQHYLTYNALGKAILYTLPPSEAARFVAIEPHHAGPRRSVVLLDEVDKAPRDFPNDILNELENMSFYIAELEDVVIKADERLAPLVIITSNSEKNLPDAFLRRCVYYHIPFPEPDRLRKIVDKRLTSVDFPDKFLSEAIDFFVKLRNLSPRLQKRPSTSELLGWIVTLRALTQGSRDPFANKGAVRQAMSVLVKTETDLERAIEFLRSFSQRSSRG